MSGQVHVVFYQMGRFRDRWGGVFDENFLVGIEFLQLRYKEIDGSSDLCQNRAIRQNGRSAI